MVKRGPIIVFFLLALLFVSDIALIAKKVTDNHLFGLELQGGYEILYEVKPVNKGEKITKDVLKGTVNTLEKRVRVLGINDYSMQLEGNRIRVLFANVTNRTEVMAGLSKQLESPVPVKLEEIYSTSVGAQYGDKSLSKTIFAAIVGLGLVTLFLVIVYRFQGLIAVMTYMTSLSITLFIVDWMNVDVTIPVIAALILGVGIAVDANKITFERVKEEVQLGKNIRLAFKEGSIRSIIAIINANLVVFLVGIVLFIFGTGSIKGFSLALLTIILTNFLIIILLSRVLMGVLVRSGFFDERLHFYGVKKEEGLQQFHEGQLPVLAKFKLIDVLKYRRPLLMLSTLVVFIGFIILLVFKMNNGIDFSTGTRIEVLAGKEITANEMIHEMEILNLDIERHDVVLSGAENEIGVVHFQGKLEQQKIDDIKKHFNKVYGTEPNVSTFSPALGTKVAEKAIIGLIISIIGIGLYVATRYKLYIAMAIVTSLLYELFFVVAFFSATRLEINIPFIAVLLTIGCYSLYNKVVIFDRIRENSREIKVNSFENLKLIVNRSLQSTIIRSLTTVLIVVTIMVVFIAAGSPTTINFFIALLIGFICVWYTSLFIAPQLWFIWKGKQLNNTIKTLQNKPLQRETHS